jgi:hypothetical protein
MPLPPNILYQITQDFIAVFNIGELSQLFAGHLNVDLQRIINPSQFVTNDQLFFNSLDWLNKRDQLADAVAAARAERPRSVELMKAEELLGLSASSRIIEIGSTDVTTRTSLEKKVQKEIQAVDIAVFLKRVSAAEPCVCRIEIPLPDNEIVYGTGFLIDEDHIMTNWHIAEMIEKHHAFASVRLRFGLKKDAAGKEISRGRVYGLASEWLKAWRPYAPGDLSPSGRAATANELDYAVLTVAGTPGTDTILEAAVVGVPQPRGYLDIADVEPVPAPNLTLFVLGHPSGDPLVVSIGRVLSQAKNGLRLRHDAYTLNGSSGSPVFDPNFNLVGLHHAGDPAVGTAQYNQAIPLTLVAADIKNPNPP